STLIVPCNGCYSTLKSAHVKLTSAPALKEKVNGVLAGIDLTFTGSVKVKHLVEFLHDDIMPSRIQGQVVHSMRGLRIAAHPGCHMLRPSSAISFDDPVRPVKIDALIGALGAAAVDYPSKMLCCGSGLAFAGEQEDSFAVMRKKLHELRGLGADALTLTCPACFMQFDQRQALLIRRGEKPVLPVFMYPQLLGLAMGFSAAEMGLASHRVDTAPFFTAWEQRESAEDTIRSLCNLADVKRCYQCGACVADCPAAAADERFQPNELIGRFLAGEVDELVNSIAPWLCLECHTCFELCPQKFGMEKVFEALKHLALERGTAPAPIKGGVDLFAKSGRLAEPDVRSRKKLGLPPLPDGGGAELRKLLGEDGR
ncbi:MAG TPA: heterodisulfide reductase-related iron-sulfur binding cluster, partial [Spirochaetia bacterium]|nr:heterodisulfide reductase-related iron-sulfur binding cluster [Spirochaetia bacterium]